MPDDLRWSWCNRNRNKVHNKCNAFESSLNHPHPTLSPWKNCLPRNLSPVPKKLGIASLGDHNWLSSNGSWTELKATDRAEGLLQMWKQDFHVFTIIPLSLLCKPDFFPISNMSYIMSLPVDSRCHYMEIWAVSLALAGPLMSHFPCCALWLTAASCLCRRGDLWIQSCLRKKFAEPSSAIWTESNSIQRSM